MIQQVIRDIEMRLTGFFDSLSDEEFYKLLERVGFKIEEGTGLIICTDE